CARSATYYDYGAWFAYW
nr:immunoglobulin heavy chain junction region [Mus musculus]NSM09239.1 immunoglobulin heavy chain junction region [Mus musculus]